MSRAAKVARRRARQNKRESRSTSLDPSLADMQAEIWHRHRPPATAIEALSTACGYPVPVEQRQVFVDLDAELRRRGWAFNRLCSGPEVLTWWFPPSDLGEVYLDRGLEPITTVVATLDRTLDTDHVGDCEVEVLLAGRPFGHGQFTSLPGLGEYLAAIEDHRIDAAVPLPLPHGRARVPN
ncbi:hypothetical protein [Nocardia brasiliensis]|uniref:hypothetical protein n=1 Tax=Nocardia brasiliensis TaxID=37326 RepID=UPI0018936E15|nr:hypothetical protein [Nocardia brasiliensis]MBF6548889.1 hypothetical protein [Nocardia brasiliensis]